MADGKLVFGTDGALEPTPIYIKNIYRALMFISFIWVAALDPRFPNIPVQIKYDIVAWLGVLNTAVYAFCNCFGYKCPEKIDMSNDGGSVVHDKTDPTV